MYSCFQRGLNWLNVTQGTVSTLVKNGLLQLDEMQKTNMSRQHLFTALRGNKIYNLGKAKRVYFEACGMINIYLEYGDKPGLHILPTDELDFILKQTHVDKSSRWCLASSFPFGLELSDLRLSEQATEYTFVKCPNCSTLRNS